MIVLHPAPRNERRSVCGSTSDASGFGWDVGRRQTSGVGGGTRQETVLFGIRKRESHLSLKITVHSSCYSVNPLQCDSSREQHPQLTTASGPNARGPSSRIGPMEPDGTKLNTRTACRGSRGSAPRGCRRS